MICSAAGGPPSAWPPVACITSATVSRIALATLRAQCLARDDTVVAGMLGALDLLIRFVALPRDDDEVAGAGERDGPGDRAAAIGLDLDLRATPGHPAENLRDDGGGLFAPGIVRGHDGDVGQRGDDRPHRRTLRAVAIAAGPEDDDGAAADEIPRRPNDVVPPIGRVGG